MGELGEKIYNLRKAKGMTLEELGDAVGVGKSTVRKWENGIIANMRRDKISLLAKALGVSPGYLLGYEEEPSHYIDKESEDLAQFLFDNPNYKVLFDASRKVKPEDIRKVAAMIELMSKDTDM